MDPLPMFVGGWEFTTYRSSPTTTNPLAIERFVSVDARAEHAWTEYAKAARLPEEYAQSDHELTGRERTKLAFLSGWHAHELTGGS